MKNGLLPVCGKDCTILILGSLPGELSLQKQQYYAHPRNAFWKIMFEILGEDFSEDYSSRCDILLKNNIAMWDVLHSAEREKSSLDSDIKNEVVNDFSAFLKEHPQIIKVLINGSKAYSLWKKYCSDIDVKVIPLPSTSPANARMGYGEKLRAWRSVIL